MMRDRLKRLIDESGILCRNWGDFSHNYCAEYIAKYLIANGVIVPPCKVGTDVYFADFLNNTVLKGRILGLSADKDGIYLVGMYKVGARFIHAFDSVGKTVFLTREEAEQTLKGGAE